MNGCQGNLEGPDSGFFSANFTTPDGKKEETDHHDHKKEEEEEEVEDKEAVEDVVIHCSKLRSELESFRNSVNLRMRDLLKCEERRRRKTGDESDGDDDDDDGDPGKSVDTSRSSTSVSTHSGYGPNYGYGGALYCVAIKVEEMLKNLSKSDMCGIPNCKTIIQQEMEKIRLVKTDLENFEVKSSKNLSGSTGQPCNGSKPVVSINSYKNFEVVGYTGTGSVSACNLIHLTDVEAFREKAVGGVAALEEMREQVDIMRNVVQGRCSTTSYDKATLETCEDKFECLREELDDITYELCEFLQRFEGTKGNMSVNPCDSCCSDRMDGAVRADTCSQTEDPVCNCQSLQGEICDRQVEVERLQDLAGRLRDEVDSKRTQIGQQNKELHSRMCEVVRLVDLMDDIGQRLMQTQCEGSLCASSSCELEFVPHKNVNTLKSFFGAMKDFYCILDKTKGILCDVPRYREENRDLSDKICYLEKCISNKEETMKVLQDTIRLRESQVDEYRSRVECSESQTSRLSQDVEEKCRLIVNLQEAVRKCKEFETSGSGRARVQSLEFRVCDLTNKLKKSEKAARAREKKIEDMRNQMLALSTKNYFLRQEMNALEPRLKSVYKTCHMFENIVSDLEGQLKERECEIDGLFGKIKELEGDLDLEFQKCEERACEDSKRIEELTATVQGFQRELCCRNEAYTQAVAEAEETLLREREMYKGRERDLVDKVNRLRCELKEARDAERSSQMASLETIIRQGESRHQVYDKKIADLQDMLDCTMAEREEERKIVLQKLCDEKSENQKNKAIITELNETLRQKTLAEKSLRECVQRFKEDNAMLQNENDDLKNELDIRKNELGDSAEPTSEHSPFEKLICRLKEEKSNLQSYCNTLRDDLDREVKRKRVLECRVEDLASLVETKFQQFAEVVDNYQCLKSQLHETMMNTLLPDNEAKCRDVNGSSDDPCTDFNDPCMKTPENAKLFTRLLILRIEMESLRSEYFSAQAEKDKTISRLKYDANCYRSDVDKLRDKLQKFEGENTRLQTELDSYVDKTANMQTAFREKQKELCARLRSTVCEKNDLLSSIDKLQKQLERICIENVNKEKMNRELAEECSRLKVNTDANDNYKKSKTDKIICNLNKEVKNLQCELCNLQKNYDALNEEYQALVDEFKMTEKKKMNLEKLYVQANNENVGLHELKINMEKELCELRNQNLLLKDKIMAANKSDSLGDDEDKKALQCKLRDLAMKMKTLEKRIVPELEQEIATKNCCIENLRVELRDANISSQRMRNEALRVIQHTKKYLGAQRCANEGLKLRLESANKRGNLLGAENRELEEQLKSVTRMNEYLLCQLETSKGNDNDNDDDDEDRSPYSPLPRGCAIVERDTSSSEYVVESGIQSMQPSPTNMDCNMYNYKQDGMRGGPQWSSLKRNKYGGSAEYPPCRSNNR